MTTLKVAAIQPQLRVGEVEWNLRRCEELIRKAAAETGADVIVLPEAVTSPNGYTPSPRRRASGCSRPWPGTRAGGGAPPPPSPRGPAPRHTYVLAEAGGATHLHDK